MNKVYMITNRKVRNNDLSDDLDGRETRHYTSTKTGNELCSLASWSAVSADEFQAQLAAEAAKFPDVDQDLNEQQRHVSLFVHGYNNTWQEAVKRYVKLRAGIFSGKKSLGIPVLFTWPSDGSVAAYLSDREDARASAPQLADVFVRLNEHLLRMQRAAAVSAIRNGALEGGKQDTICRAKVSVIAHSMGNYVVQKALAIAARKLNSPQLVTLVHQLVMVAADVDNDIFQIDQPEQSDGSLMANLCYRISALHSGLDQTLAASAGLKHFGTRRLGRSGLASASEVWDNVCSFNVTPLIENAGSSMHSAALDAPESLKLIKDILRGVDRRVLLDQYHLEA